MALPQPFLVRTVLQLRGTACQPWLRQTCNLRFECRRGYQNWSTIKPKVKPTMQGFHSTAPKQAMHDASTMDYCFMPQFELSYEPPPEATRIPLLPTNFISSNRIHAQQEAIEPVVRPEISTVSADSTHIASPSAMSEVTDNHAIELDPFDLTAKVTAAAKKMGELPAEKLKEVGVMRELWMGLLDDLMGGRRVGKA